MTFLTELLPYVKSLLMTDTCNYPNTLNHALESISNWTCQWKLQFNPHSKKSKWAYLFL